MDNLLHQQLVSNNLLLLLAIFTPIGIGFFLLLGKNWPERVVKNIALIGFLIPVLTAAWLWAIFSSSPPEAHGYHFMIDIPMGLKSFLGISLKLGLNGISTPLFFMAGWIGLAAGIFVLYGNADRRRYYLILLLLMHGGLMGVFASIDLFFFYFFHEIALIPTFIMIAFWGGRNRRLVAMQTVIYLTIGALLSLVGLIALYIQSGATAFDIISLKEALAAKPLPDKEQIYIFGVLLLGLGILVSLWPFHSWAPPAYTAAPTAVAMMHAGVLKNFGLYGLIQFVIPCLGVGAVFWMKPLVLLALGNVIIIGLVTLAQFHLKKMIAYGSVMHMGYIFLGIASLSVIGVGGATFLMFAHGFSVALLLLLSTIIYHRSRTFDLDAFGGLARHTPILASLFITAMLASLGLPGLANFWGELMIFLALWDLSPLVLVLAILGIILSSIYGLRAIAKIFFGPTKQNDKIAHPGPKLPDLRWHEKLPAFLLLFVIVVIGIWPKPVTNLINKTVEKDYPLKEKAEFMVQDHLKESLDIDHFK